MVRSKTQEPIGHWVSFVDAKDGSLLNVHNEVRFFEGSAHATHDLRTLDGELMTSPLKFLKIGDSTHSDELGFFSTEEEGLVAELNGRYTNVRNQAGENLQFDVVEGETLIESAQEEDMAQIDQYIFQNHKK